MGIEGGRGQFEKRILNWDPVPMAIMHSNGQKAIKPIITHKHTHTHLRISYIIVLTIEYQWKV